MIIPGQTLYVLEMEPAAYAPLAANEAEKAANINILEVRSFGSMGRVYLGGEERGHRRRLARGGGRDRGPRGPRREGVAARQATTDPAADRPAGARHETERVRWQKHWE